MTKSKSVNRPFPRDGDMKANLFHCAKVTVFAKEGKVYVDCFGLCAMDFQTKMINRGISSFLSKDDSNSAEHISADATKVWIEASKVVHKSSEEMAEIDKDLELTWKLQVSYDWEDYVLTAAEKWSRIQPKQATSKRLWIDNFFQNKA